jgi:S-DNA-T family DNA segregation ATPase FtsK/SpoIIIE
MEYTRRNEIIGVVFIGLALLILLSFLFSPLSTSVSPEGISIQHYWMSLTQNLDKQGKMGWLGYGITVVLRFLLGYCVFLLPILLSILGIKKIKGREISSPFVGSILFLLLTPSLIALFFPNKELTTSGILGWFLSKWLLKIFGVVGAYIFLFTFLIVTFLISSQFPLSAFFSKLALIALFPLEVVKRIVPKKKKPRKVRILKPRSVIPPQEVPESASLSKEELPPAEPEKKLETTSSYTSPPLELLEDYPSRSAISDEEIFENTELLLSTLKSFGIEGKIESVSRGPVVTRYELQPTSGTKVTKIANLATDIGVAFGTTGVRIEAPVVGKTVIGIEIPNSKKDIVGLKEILVSEKFQKTPSLLKIVIGKEIGGNPVIANLREMPHLLIAGTTGSGKSVCLNSIICTLLLNTSPRDVRLIMIDPKQVEFSLYERIPHLLAPIIKEPKQVSKILKWVVGEMDKRYKVLAQEGVRNIEGYNKICLTKDNKSFEGELREPLPYWVIIIDELADLMIVSPKEVESSICRLAQMARGVGIHLIIATQRPSVNVITGLIKANIPSRISFAVSSQVDSRTILDINGAENLIGEGDMLFLPIGLMKPVRVQGAYVSEREVRKITNFLKKVATPNYLWDEKQMDEKEEPSASQKDELYEDAVRLVIKNKQASVTWLQRKLGIGYARAAKLMDLMEEEGIVSPPSGPSKIRDVLQGNKETQ